MLYSFFVIYSKACRCDLITSVLIKSSFDHPLIYQAASGLKSRLLTKRTSRAVARHDNWGGGADIHIFMFT
jgi:hypothetical protein